MRLKLAIVGPSRAPSSFLRRLPRYYLASMATSRDRPREGMTTAHTLNELQHLKKLRLTHKSHSHSTCPSNNDPSGKCDDITFHLLSAASHWREAGRRLDVTFCRSVFVARTRRTSYPRASSEVRTDLCSRKAFLQVRTKAEQNMLVPIFEPVTKRDKITVLYRSTCLGR